MTDNLVTALPFCFLGTALISAANPPLDAARLDIMPPGLWGRAESVRTFLRSIAQALAPLLFGGVSDLIAGFEPQKAPIGTHTVGPVSTATGDGLQITFLIMLVSLLAAGWFLLAGASDLSGRRRDRRGLVVAEAAGRRWRRRSRRGWRSRRQVAVPAKVTVPATVAVRAAPRRRRRRPSTGRRPRRG